MMIHLRNQCDQGERGQLQRFLCTPRADKRSGEVAWVRALMDRYGSIEYAREVAHGLSGAALSEFDHLFAGVPESRDLEFIRELPTWVLERA